MTDSGEQGRQGRIVRGPKGDTGDIGWSGVEGAPGRKGKFSELVSLFLYECVAINRYFPLQVCEEIVVYPLSSVKEV